MVAAGDYDHQAAGTCCLKTTGPERSDRALEAGPSVRDRWDAPLDQP